MSRLMDNSPKRFLILAENEFTGEVRGGGEFIDLANAWIAAACWRFGNWSSYLIDTETGQVSFNGGDFYDPTED